MADSHGSFTFSFIDSVLLITASGAWNLECVEAYIAEAEAIYASTGRGQMDLVVLFLRWDGVTPDASLRLIGYTRECLRRNMFRSQTYFHRQSPFLSRLVMSLFAAAGHYEQHTFLKREELLAHMATLLEGSSLETFTRQLDQALTAGS